MAPVGAARHLEVEEQRAVAGEDRQRPQRPVLLKAAQRRDLFQPRPVFVLEHHAGRIVHDDPADHRRRHDDGERQRIVLEHEGHILADRLGCLAEIGDDLLVGSQRRRRRDHDRRGPCPHGGSRQAAHRREARRRDADNHRQILGALHDPRHHIQRLGRIELLRFAHDAEDGQAIDAAACVEIDHGVDRVRGPAGHRCRKASGQSQRPPWYHCQSPCRFPRPQCSCRLGRQDQRPGNGMPLHHARRIRR